MRLKDIFCLILSEIYLVLLYFAFFLCLIGNLVCSFVGVNDVRKQGRNQGRSRTRCYI